MSRPAIRRSWSLESLESREVLSAGGPSAEAQYMLELVNMARTNPKAMADWVTANVSPDVAATVKYYGIDLNAVHDQIASAAPRPPLAWNNQLAQAATGQSQYQADTGVQSHTGANGSNLDQRLDAVGYTNRSSDGENAYAYSESVDHAMEAFLIDWGVAGNGHRNNLLQPDSQPDQYYREVGIGIVSSNRPNFGPKVITQDFGAQNGALPYILGVAYNDPDHNHQFGMGEGQGNVQVDITNVANGQTQSVQTWDAGGYQVQVQPNTTYQVTARVNGQVVRSQQVSVGNQNAEVDFDLSDPWQGSAPPIAAQVGNRVWSQSAAVSAPSSGSTNSNSNSNPTSVASASQPQTVNTLSAPSRSAAFQTGPAWYANWSSANWSGWVAPRAS